MPVADEAATDSTGPKPVGPESAAPEPDPDELDFEAGPGLALTGRLGSAGEDGELDEPLPNGERLVAQAVALAGNDHATAHLVDRFWRFAPDEELVGYTPDEMFAAAVAHRELAANRLAGQLQLSIGAPDRAEPHTVLQIVTDDMPFLVDSVISLLTAHQLQVHLLVHPLIVVRREPWESWHKSRPRSSPTTPSRATWWRAGSGSRSTRSVTRPPASSCTTRSAGC